MERIIVHSKDYVRLICPSEIILCKSDSCYTCIHLTTHEELVMCKSLSKFAKELSLDSFIRVNQSYLVNKEFIKKIDKKKKYIELSNGNKVPFTITLKELLILISQNMATIG